MPKKPIEIDYSAFRDQIATVDDEGKRKWIYPRKPSGRFHNRRAIVAVIFLAMMFIGPFLKWDGHPLFLFNILERKFILFGVVFWPQDFHLFGLAMITFIIFIALFTVIFGRVWCGWACPQTIFMEMVFRKIEYLIEGDAPKQRKLDRQPWNREKIFKKGIKWTIFYIIALMIANLVMAYVIGVEELSKIVTEGPFAHMGKFTFVMVFSGIFFFVFAYLREQACIAICPYGRLQGTLLDQDSIVVHYDHIRGEPRDRWKKDVERESGDCIACGLCVQVCPTGIDIKDGTQLECVNCTACIDVCDDVMDKVGFKRGLIKLASFNQIENGSAFKFTPRIIAYTVVLVGLMSILGFSLGTRSPVEMTVTRARGTVYRLLDDGRVSNMYNLQIINKTHDNFPLTLKLISPEGNVNLIGGDSLRIKDQAITNGTFFLEIEPELLRGMKNEVKVGIFQGDILLDKVETNFIGPPNRGKAPGK